MKPRAENGNDFLQVSCEYGVSKMSVKLWQNEGSM